MVLTNDKTFQMRTSQEFLKKLDDWRRKQVDLPGRSEALRKLVEFAIAAQEPLAMLTGEMAALSTNSDRSEHLANLRRALRELEAK